MAGRLRSVSSDLALCGVLGCFLLAAGCNKSSDQRLDEELSRTGQSKRSVFPLAGKVLVDGQPAQGATPGQKIIVVLFNRAQPNLRVSQRPAVQCNERGEFSFSTYGSGDGIDPGEYVVVIAQLFANKEHDFCEGPDGLKNLYNDPDKNGKIPEFTINHASPGKTDYIFDLKLAGKDPDSTPGPRAVTEIPND
jgi:hypothetical protein